MTNLKHLIYILKTYILQTHIVQVCIVFCFSVLLSGCYSSDRSVKFIDYRSSKFLIEYNDVILKAVCSCSFDNELPNVLYSSRYKEGLYSTIEDITLFKDKKGNTYIVVSNNIFKANSLEFILKEHDNKVVLLSKEEDVFYNITTIEAKESADFINCISIINLLKN